MTKTLSPTAKRRAGPSPHSARTGQRSKVTAALDAAQASKYTNGRIPTGPEVIPMTITPEIAGDWIGKNLNNRKLRDHRSLRLAKEITEGRWHDLNGETIKWSDDGALLDGQHRLIAVIIAGKPIKTYVAFGVPRSAFSSIDTGLGRSAKDALFVSGEENTNGLSLALNAMYRWLDSGGFSYKGSPTNDELLAVLGAAPGLRDSSVLGMALKKRLAGVIPGVAAVIHYLAVGIDADDAQEFFERLYDGVGLTADDPIYVLRERLSKARTDNKAAPFHYQQEFGVILAKTWNFWRKEASIGSRQLRYNTGESVPEL